MEPENLVHMVNSGHHARQQSPVATMQTVPVNTQKITLLCTEKWGKPHIDATQEFQTQYRNQLTLGLLKTGITFTSPVKC